MNETRSNKVLATLSIIDALNFDEDDLSDLTAHLAKQCGFSLHSDMMDYDKIDHARRTDTSKLHGKTGAEILEESMKELTSLETVQLAIPPVDAYNLVAIVQAAIVCLDLPEHSEATGKNFVHGFCDRYREQMPITVQCINSGWDESSLVTAEEFEESLGEKWKAIARDVEKEMGGEVKIIVDTPDGMYDSFFGLVDDIYQDIDIDDKDDDPLGNFASVSAVDKPHQGALCPINGEPCSKGGNFYYYPDDCPDSAMCEEIANDDLEDRCASGFTN